MCLQHAIVVLLYMVDSCWTHIYYPSFEQWLKLYTMMVYLLNCGSSALTFTVNTTEGEKKVNKNNTTEETEKKNFFFYSEVFFCSWETERILMKPAKIQNPSRGHNALLILWRYEYFRLCFRMRINEISESKKWLIHVGKMSWCQDVACLTWTKQNGLEVIIQRTSTQPAIFITHFSVEDCKETCAYILQSLCERRGTPWTCHQAQGHRVTNQINNIHTLTHT